MRKVRLRKRLKYGNTKVTFDNIEFDSIKEANRYRDLKLMQKANVISDLQMQVKFVLVPTQKGGIRTERAITYTADFTYIENGKFVVEDVKGSRTIQYIIKRKLMKQAGYEITEV